MNKSPPPILVCYDGSPDAKRAADTAGTLFPGQPAIVLYVFPSVASARIRTTSVEIVRDELIEEVRVAARRDAKAVAEEGAILARGAGLEAKPLTVETRDHTADAIVRLATTESAAAVVVGRPGRTQRGPLLPGSVLRSIVSDCPIPVVVV